VPLRATDIVLPVVGMEPGSSRPRELCGTAFHIGGGAYLTAAHVWKQAQTHPLQAIGMTDTPDTEVVRCHGVWKAEALEAFDLAVLSAPPFGQSFLWSKQLPALLDEVRAFGYPYGLDPESNMLTVRAFKGSVSGGNSLIKLPGRPFGLELSFPCPRGLSGAPLIWFQPEKSRIVGIVLGNQITEMEVYREAEKLVEDGKETLFIKTEALHLGLAIRADAVLSIHSETLGCTIGDWLKTYGLLDGDSLGSGTAPIRG